MAMLLVFATPATAATTFELDGHFKESFGRPANAELCDLEPPFCGDGTVRGLGKATTLDPDGAIKTITLESDGSTLVMHEEFVLFITPGASTDAPGALKSFGNPFYLELTWVADPDESTGFFEGAIGSGITIVAAAGDALIVTTTASPYSSRRAAEEGSTLARGLDPSSTRSGMMGQ
ncbi:MAG TPA: hypothetical protein VK736_12565 [Candidatus Binatia bacterium]|nr:hypothetical protein [Candidatus Binatia bacterium]